MEQDIQNKTLKKIEIGFSRHIKCILKETV